MSDRHYLRLLTIAARYWNAGLDTVDIAAEIHLPEPVVYAELGRIRRRARMLRMAEVVA